MFNFFLKSKQTTSLKKWEKDLLVKTFRLLGNDYTLYEEQITTGIIESVRINKLNSNFKRFRLNVKLLNKFENKKGRSFFLHNIKVFDNISNKYFTLSLDFGFGLILGYSMNESVNFNPEIEVINVDSIYKTYYGEDDFNKIKFLFSKEELLLINPSEVYELDLLGKIYYHLIDLEDGDFLAVDIDKNIYEITHGPFEINLQKNELVNLLK